MGDIRFTRQYDRIRRAGDVRQAIAHAPDDALVQALAGAAEGAEPYLVNVLATEVLNRVRTLSRTVESITEGVVTLDLDGVVTFANPAAQQLLGRVAEDLLGHRLHRIVHGAGCAGCALGQAAASEGAALLGEDEFLRADGARVPVTYEASPLASGGDRIGTVVAFRDETERRRAETALRESEALLSEAEHLAHLGCWEWDADTNVVSWSRELYAIFGIEPGSIPVTYDTYLSRIHPDDRELVWTTVMDVAQRGGSFHFDHRIVRTDGSVAWLRCFGQFAGDHAARSRRMIGTALDITEVKALEEENWRATQAFREEEARLLLVLGHAPVILFALDRGGVVRLAEGRGLEGLALRQEDVVGRSIFDLETTSPDLVASARRALAGETFAAVVMQNGRVYDVKWAPTRPDEADGVTQAAVTAAAVDVTERARALESLERRRADLEAAVEARTREITSAYRDLEAFSYSVSHDLRAPLRAIDVSTELLLEDVVDAAPREHAHRIRREVRRLSRLVEDLLSLSRVAAEPVARRTVDVTSLVHEVVASLREAEPSRRVEVLVQEGVVARADPSLLRIALENLLGNAWKYTRRASAPRVEFGAVRAADGTRTYFVRDNGVGFDMARAGLLFRPFQRLHAPAEFEGTGIGLATVRRVIDHHGGRVSAEGAPGEGATVSFTLGPEDAPEP